MHSTLFSLALITVNNKSYLASSQWSCILQDITCVETGFPAPRISSVKQMLDE